MKKSKRVLIVLIILLVVMSIIVAVLINSNKKQETLQNGQTTSINENYSIAFEDVNDYKTYFTIKEIAENYITYMKQINGDEYVDSSSLQMTYAQIAEEMQSNGVEALKGILDNEYSNDDSSLIKMQDEYKKDGTYTKQVNYNLNIDNMYQYNLANNISLVLLEAKLNNKDLNLLIKLDLSNNTYSLFLSDYIEKNNYKKNMEAKNIKVSKNNIQKNDYNNDIMTHGTEKDVVLQYFSEYKIKMLNDTQTAYQKLDSEYAEKKFGQYSTFESYVNSNKNSIQIANIAKYQVVENTQGKEYVCVDENGKYYIFNEEKVGKYTVILDTYTIDLPEFLEKYNSANDKVKVGMNIQKIFDAINDKDYEYVYNKLDNTFRQNNFSTLQNFTNYVEQNLANKQLEYGECQQQGSLYIFDISISNGTTKTNKQVIMQLKDGTDFVMSFSVT